MTHEEWRAEALSLLRSRFRPLLSSRLDRELPRIAADAVDGDEAGAYLGLLREGAACRERDLILDIGSGFGAFVHLARRQGYRAVGLEPSTVDLDLARRRLPDRSDEFVQGVAEALPFASDRFDLVTLFNTLEHVGDPSLTIGEAARVCRPGGYVFVLAPNYAFRWSEPHYHVRWLPGLPRSLYHLYLRRRGADPGFLETIQFVTRGRVRALAFRAGLLPIGAALKADKWARPQLIRRRWLRLIVRAVRVAGLSDLAQRLHARLPRQNIDLLFRKDSPSST